MWVFRCSNASQSTASAQISPTHVLSRSQVVDRRAALGLMAAAVVGARVAPAEAAYGDAARVFAGKITNKSGMCRSHRVEGV